MNEEKYILYVDDDELHRETFKRNVENLSRGYSSLLAEDENETFEILSKFSKKIIIVFIDFNLGEGKPNGVKLGKKLMENYSDLYLIMLTGYYNMENQGEALRSGVFKDFINKENLVRDLHSLLDKAEGFVTSVKKIIKKHEDKIEFLSSLLSARKIDTYKLTELDELKGSSSSMLSIKKWIRKYSETDETVLISGESGTGKELVAKLIHKNSNRCSKPFIVVNCAAIPKELIESELFGHVKGAFTNATFEKKGKFLEANGGTLFLDEIGDLTLDAQAKILRAIQERKIDMVGGQIKRKVKDKEGYESERSVKELGIRVDIRIICATNKPLLDMINEGNFRSDLYYRISGFFPSIPTLRKRQKDIPELISFFISLSKKRTYQSNLINEYFTEKAIKILVGHCWLGNVRELQRFVNQLIFLFPEKKPFNATEIGEALEFWKKIHPEKSEVSQLLKEKLNEEDKKNISLSYDKIQYDDLTKSVENRLNLIVAAIKEGGNNKKAKLIKSIIENCHQINNDKSLLYKYNVYKVDNLGQSPNIIGNIFRDNPDIVTAIIDKFPEKFTLIYDIKPYQNMVAKKNA